MRRAVVALVALLVVVLSPSPAVLGGGSVFDFERRYYLPGERAVGQTVFWVPAKDKALLDRTFYAYLLGGSRWIHPPIIPGDAVPLGPVSLEGLARISFTVPEVAPGNYTVAICDRPCRHSYVGDLMGGWITVVGSAEEIRLRRTIDRLERRLSDVHSQLARRLTGNQERTGSLQARVEQLEEEIAQGQEALGARMTRLDRGLEGEPGAFDRAGWIVALVALATLAFVSVRRSRAPAQAAPSPAMPPLDSEGDDLRWRIEAIEEEERTPAGVR